MEHKPKRRRQSNSEVEVKRDVDAETSDVAEQRKQRREAKREAKRKARELAAAIDPRDPDSLLRNLDIPTGEVRVGLFSLMSDSFSLLVLSCSYHLLFLLQVTPGGVAMFTTSDEMIEMENVGAPQLSVQTYPDGHTTATQIVEVQSYTISSAVTICAQGGMSTTFSVIPK